MKEVILDMLEGEKWWGGAISHGTQMPFDASSDYVIDLYEHETHNQTQPLLISNKGRVIWSDSGFKISMRAGKMLIKSHQECIIESTNGDLKTAYQAARKYINPTTDIPDANLFKVPQYNSWIELMYDQSEENLLKYAHEILEKGYAPGVLMIDDNWQEDYGVWQFNGTRFNDPKGMIEKIKSLGFEIMLWVCPFVSPDSLTFRELRKKDYLIKDSQGKVAIREWWNGFSGVLDLTNPGAWAWFKEQLDTLVDVYGVKGFKFDAGDLWNYHEGDQTYQPITPLEQVKLYSEFCAQYPYNELRTGYKTAHLCLTQRLCDKNHSWGDTGVGGLIPNGLMQSMMGYDYNCPDMIGGGEYLNFLESSLDLDESLVVRYAQIAALFPIMQFSVSPWRVLSEENNQLCLEAAKIHHNFGDYIMGQIKSSHQQGLPLMRHMAIAYPNNGYENLDDQFMLGDDLLVAPVTKKDQYERKVYLPEGTWISDENEVLEGPQKISIEVPLARLPYFKRK